MPRKPPIPGAPKSEPWKPVDWELSDASAIQALNRGEASPEQQQRALKFIIEMIAGTYDMAYRPASARDTDFALGRAFVGQQIVKLLKVSIGAMSGKPSEQP